MPSIRCADPGSPDAPDVDSRDVESSPTPIGADHRTGRLGDVSDAAEPSLSGLASLERRMTPRLTGRFLDGVGLRE